MVVCCFCDMLDKYIGKSVLLSHAFNNGVCLETIFDQYGFETIRLVSSNIDLRLICNVRPQLQRRARPRFTRGSRLAQQYMHCIVLLANWGRSFFRLRGPSRLTCLATGKAT